MEFKIILFLTLFINIWSVNNADLFMPEIVGNKLVLFRVTEEERDELMSSTITNDKEDAAIASLKNNFKTSQSFGEKSGHKSEVLKKENVHKKEHDSNEHNKDWLNKSENDEGLEEDGSYSSKVGRDKHGSSFSDSGYRSHYNRDKGHEFEKSWSLDKERGHKDAFEKKNEENGRHKLIDKGSQLRLKKWSADGRKNEGSHSNLGSQGSKAHHKKFGSKLGSKLGSLRMKKHNNKKWKENSGYSSQNEQQVFHKSIPNHDRNKYESEEHKVSDDESGEHQKPDASQENNNYKEEEEVLHDYDYELNNKNKFDINAEQNAQPVYDSHNEYHFQHPLTKSESPTISLENTEEAYHETSLPNPQNHKRHETYESHYMSSSNASVPKSNSKKWEVNSDENIAKRKPQTNTLSYDNKEDNHKNNNEPMMKSWSAGRGHTGYSYTITESPVNYDRSHFGHNKAYLINH